jgi:hypothetical protein
MTFLVFACSFLKMWPGVPVAGGRGKGKSRRHKAPLYRDFQKSPLSSSTVMWPLCSTNGDCVTNAV